MRLLVLAWQLSLIPLGCASPSHPLVASGSADCSANSECGGMLGQCCPSPSGVFLSCCDDSPLLWESGTKYIVTWPSGVSVRARRSSDSSVVATYGYGRVFVLLEERGSRTGVHALKASDGWMDAACPMTGELFADRVVPKAPGDLYLVTGGRGLDLRSGLSLDSPVVDRLWPGQRTFVVERAIDASGDVLLRTSGGWVSDTQARLGHDGRSLFLPVVPKVPELHVSSDEDGLLVQSGPDLSSDKVALLRPGKFRVFERMALEGIGLRLRTVLGWVTAAGPTLFEEVAATSGNILPANPRQRPVDVEPGHGASISKVVSGMLDMTSNTRPSPSEAAQSTADRFRSGEKRLRSGNGHAESAMGGVGKRKEAETSAWKPRDSTNGIIPQEPDSFELLAAKYAHKYRGGISSHLSIDSDNVVDETSSTKAPFEVESGSTSVTSDFVFDWGIEDFKLDIGGSDNSIHYYEHSFENAAPAPAHKEDVEEAQYAVEDESGISLDALKNMIDSKFKAQVEEKAAKLALDWEVASGSRARQERPDLSHTFLQGELEHKEEGYHRALDQLNAVDDAAPTSSLGLVRRGANLGTAESRSDVDRYRNDMLTPSSKLDHTAGVDEAELDLSSLDDLLSALSPRTRCSAGVDEAELYFDLSSLDDLLSFPPSKTGSKAGVDEAELEYKDRSHRSWALEQLNAVDDPTPTSLLGLGNRGANLLTAESRSDADRYRNDMLSPSSKPDHMAGVDEEEVDLSSLDDLLSSLSPRTRRSAGAIQAELELSALGDLSSAPRAPMAARADHEIAATASQYPAPRHESARVGYSSTSWREIRGPDIDRWRSQDVSSYFLTEPQLEPAPAAAAAWNSLSMEVAPPADNPHVSPELPTRSVQALYRPHATYDPWSAPSLQEVPASEPNPAPAPAFYKAWDAPNVQQVPPAGFTPSSSQASARSWSSQPAPQTHQPSEPMKVAPLSHGTLGLDQSMSHTAFGEPPQPHALNMFARMMPTDTKTPTKQKHGPQFSGVNFKR